MLTITAILDIILNWLLIQLVENFTATYLALKKTANMTRYDTLCLQIKYKPNNQETDKCMQ